MLVVLNPSASAGTALHRWKKIERQVEALVGPFTLVVADDIETVKSRIAAAIQDGETEFIAAGGDGTVNLVMTCIVQTAPPRSLPRMKLGAVGLGSSNDFHKPTSDDRQIEGVPLRLDFVSTIWHDICLLTYRDEAENLLTRRWLVNASIGTTAEANRLFNGSDVLKRVSVWLGMVCAALRALLRYRGDLMTVTLDETETIHVRVKNLGIVKNPHFTGSLRYDSPYEPDSGHFYVHLLPDVSFLKLARTLFGLRRGKFSAYEDTRSWRANRLRVGADRPFAVEGDGEVITTNRAYFSVVPGLLQVCN